MPPFASKLFYGSAPPSMPWEPPPAPEVPEVPDVPDVPDPPVEPEVPDPPGPPVTPPVTPPYTALEYVCFDGQTGIDTGIDQLGLPTVFCDYQHTSLTANAQFYMPFGVRAAPGNASSFLLVGNATNSRTIFQYGAVMKASTLGTMALTTNRRTIQIEGKKATLTDGSTATVTSTADEPVTAGNLWLGCGSDQGAPIAGSMFVGKVYAFQISKGGVLALDLIPARVGNTVGLWDTVAGRLLTPAVGALTGA